MARRPRKLRSALCYLDTKGILAVMPGPRESTIQTASSENGQSSVEYCRDIAARGRPHLYVAAQLFESAELRNAFFASYASMRIVDDAIDSIPDRTALSASHRTAYERQVETWRQSVHACHAGNPPSGRIWEALALTFQATNLPIQPWDEMARSMTLDLSTPQFPTWDFLEDYMTGATIAPAVVFTSLVLSDTTGTGSASGPQWSYGRTLHAIRDLGIFCYLTHILRDAAIDLEIGDHGLIYFPTECLREFDLDSAALHGFRSKNRVDDRFQRLAESVAGRAWLHHKQGQTGLAEISKSAPAQNLAALHYLIDVYVQLLRKLKQHGFNVFNAPIEMTNPERRDVMKSTLHHYPVSDETLQRWESALPVE